jgi:hypothetical protein
MPSSSFTLEGHTVQLKYVLLLAAIPGLVSCSSTKTPAGSSASSTPAVEAKATPTPKPEPAWEHSQNKDPLRDITEDAFYFDGTYVPGYQPHGLTFGDPEILLLCAKHKVTQVQLKPGVYIEYDYYPSYLDSPLLMKLDDEKKTWRVGIADSRKTFLLKQSQIAEILKHKLVLVGVKNEGVESMINFQVPAATAELRSSCSL